MISFKPLGLEDRDVFMRYLGEYGFNTYEYTFLTLYFWRDMCKVEYALLEDTLIIRKHNKNTGYYFMQPLGYKQESLPDIAARLKCFKDRNSGFGSLFGDVEIPFLEELQRSFGDRLVFREDSDNFDYIYDSKQLVSLSGNKFHRKKNQYNQFISGYSYEVRDLSQPEVRKACIDFSKVWYEAREDKSEQLTYELSSIEEVLTHSERLNLKGIAVYVDNSLAGFAIGEKANSRMAVVHAEKGDLAYNGIYSFLNKTLIEKCFNDVEHVNRQEDMGIPGLRKAKMAYQPVRLEKKFIVDIK